MKRVRNHVLVFFLMLPSLAHANMLRNPSMNGDFQDGVAEYWQVGGAGHFFKGDQSRDAGGSSQLILQTESSQAAYLYQRVDELNPGESYKLSAWFKPDMAVACSTSYLQGEATVECSIGADTTGGSDPNNVSNWMTVQTDVTECEGCPEEEWFQIRTSFTPDSTSATVFIRVKGSSWGICLEGDELRDVLSLTACYVDDVVVSGRVIPGLPLTVTITPAEAVRLGAQWRVDGGKWLDSQETARNLSPGYHRIEFAEIPLWERPESFSIRLIEDCVETAVGTYEQVKFFPVGQISPQTVWHGETLRFMVAPDEPGHGHQPNLLSAGPMPEGEVSWDPAWWTFSYQPHPQDKWPFSATFGSTGPETEPDQLQQTVEICPVPILPDEEDALGMEPNHPVPDPASRDYTFVAEVDNDEPEPFNCETRPTRSVTISAKTLVLEAGTWPYDSYNDCKHIKTMEIFAETLIIRSPLNLPQTTVTIGARELRFEDPPGAAVQACINTTPDSLTTRPAGTQGTNGKDGLEAGDILLFVESFHSGSTLDTRFILKGGNGQAAGEGRDGRDGTKMKTLWGEDPEHTVYIEVQDLDTREVLERYGVEGWPGDGEPAVRPGKPGEGGSGGLLVSNLEVGAFGDFAGGLAGAKASDRVGGKAGTPTHACWYLVLRWFGADIWEEWECRDFSDGAGAAAPDANSPIGPTGHFQRLDRPAFWLTSEALRMILAHAKDTYLYGHFDEAREILQEYKDLLEIHMASPWWDDWLEEQQYELESIYNEIMALLHRIDNNLDYFGNPAGWVPMLSFEVNKLMFEAEIEHAIDVLYLTYWIRNEANDIEDMLDALETAQDQLWTEIEQYKSDYNDVVTLIPDLETELLTVSNQEEYMTKYFQNYEQQLVRQAQQNVEERHRVPEWKKFAKVGAAICQVCPVGQPYLAGASIALNMLSDYDSDDPWKTVTSAPQLIGQYEYAKYGESEKAWKEEVDKIELRVLKKDPSDPNAGYDFKRYCRNLTHFSKPIVQAAGTVGQALKKTQVPKGEVEAELDRIRSSSAEFRSVTREVSQLNAQKELLSRQLAEAMQETLNLLEGITHNVLAIDGMNRQAAPANEVLDPQCLMYLDEMERRARERLLKYHYYMAKAYEYRMLQPYPGDLKLHSMFENLKAIAEQTAEAPKTGTEKGRLGPEDFEALKAVYTGELRMVVDTIYSTYAFGRKEADSNDYYDLTAYQIQQLNAGETITINPMDLGFFYSWEEAVRITRIEVEVIDVNVPSEASGKLHSFKLRMEHGGESKLILDGKVSKFRHYTRRDQEPIYWQLNYSTDGDMSYLDVEDRSAASDSMLAVLLTLPGGDIPSSDKIMFYSRPAGWSDIHITKRDHPYNIADIDLTRVRLKISYDFFERKKDLVELNIVVPEEGLKPYIILDEKDQNGRQDGRGSFRRYYKKGQIVTLMAPERYGSWLFEKWTDGVGRELGPQPTAPTLLWPLDKDTTLCAHYVCEVMLIQGRITTPEGVGIIGATVSAEGGETSLGVTTDDDGFYSLTVPREWSGTVTPSKVGYAFGPADTVYSSVASDQTGQDYAGTGPATLPSPTGLAASDGTYLSRIRVTWDAAAGASHYRVYRSASLYGPSMALSDWQTETVYDDMTPLRGWKYFYRVRSASSETGDQASDYSWYDVGRLSEEAPMADVNGDYIVNSADFALLAERWLATDCGPDNYACGGADIAPETPDGFVNAADLAVLADNWLAGIGD